MTRINLDLYGWNYAARPERAFQPYRSINLKFVFVYLFAEIETNADAIIVFGDFADSTESGVAAQGSQRLDDGKQFLRLEENADARCVLGGETIEAEQQTAFQVDGVSLLVEGVSAAPSLSVYLGIEGAVLIELEISV